jgi:hypothetical protein
MAGPRTTRVLALATSTVSRLAQGRDPRQLVRWAAIALAVGWVVTIADWCIPNDSNGGLIALSFFGATVLFAAAVIASVGLAASALGASALGAIRSTQTGVYAPPVPRWVPTLSVALIALAPGSFIVGELIGLIIAVS